jgi:5-methylcytosine-specific restriction protein A
MPSRPPRLGQRARQLKKERLPDHREQSQNRGYDARSWRPLSKMVRMEEPLCRACLREGRVEAATCVDHIIPVTTAPELRLVRSNLQALCHACHTRKTRAEMLHK